MQGHLTTNTTGGQVTSFPCLPLSDSAFEEAVYHLHVYARSDALGFSCQTGNLSTMAREAIALAMSPDGSPLTLPNWQYELLFCEYIDMLVTTLQRRGRR